MEKQTGLEVFQYTMEYLILVKGIQLFLTGFQSLRSTRGERFSFCYKTSALLYVLRILYTNYLETTIYTVLAVFS